MEASAKHEQTPLIYVLALSVSWNLRFVTRFLHILSSWIGVLSSMLPDTVEGFGHSILQPRRGNRVYVGLIKLVKYDIASGYAPMCRDL